MLTEPLPTVLDVRKAVVRGATVTGTLKPQDLQRFLPLLADTTGNISVAMRFSRDEENRYLIHLDIEANITVFCQRCLEGMPLNLSSQCKLAIVWTDEEAAHLPSHLDALIVRESLCNLWEIVEDELILSIPPYNYHMAGICKLNTADFSNPDPQQSCRKEKPNPFNVLEQLKPSK
jgi:uncharacterized protein